MTTFGFGLAIPVVLTNPNPESFLIVGVPAILTTIPPLLTKDGLEEQRKIFTERLKIAESRILELQSGNSLLQQPNSLLKTAREEGWKNPEKGINLISDAEREEDWDRYQCAKLVLFFFTHIPNKILLIGVGRGGCFSLYSS